MKTCDKCGNSDFKIEFKVWGIAFICAQCGYEDRYYFKDYGE